MNRQTFFVFFFSLFFISIQAQDYIGDSDTLFRKKARLYQHWLNKKGMGEVLAVNKIEITRNGTELELWLNLKTYNPDSAASIWNELQQKYLLLQEDLTLEETLYNTFIRYMEIPPAQGNIQVYVPTPKGGYNPCFYVWLWEENGQLQKKSRVNNCKAQNIDIPIQLRNISGSNYAQQASLNYKESSKAVFEKILNYARKKYERNEKPNCEERNPTIKEIDETAYSMSFVVEDLCREVLTDERQSLWCDFVELWWGPCNDMRRERLEFEINYIPTNEGYLLKIKLTGKYGSGVYRPRKSGYMDMDPDFEDDFLEPYAKQFGRELKQFLQPD